MLNPVTAESLQVLIVKIWPLSLSQNRLNCWGFGKLLLQNSHIANIFFRGRLATVFGSGYFILLKTEGKKSEIETTANITTVMTQFLLQELYKTPSACPVYKRKLLKSVYQRLDDLSYKVWAKELEYCNNPTIFQQAHAVCVTALSGNKWSIISETAMW